MPVYLCSAAPVLCREANVTLAAALLLCQEASRAIAPQGLWTETRRLCQMEALAAQKGVVAVFR